MIKMVVTSEKDGKIEDKNVWAEDFEQAFGLFRMTHLERKILNVSIVNEKDKTIQRSIDLNGTVSIYSIPE